MGRLERAAGNRCQDVSTSHGAAASKAAISASETVPMMRLLCFTTGRRRTHHSLILRATAKNFFENCDSNHSAGRGPVSTLGSEGSEVNGACHGKTEVALV